MVFWVPDAVSDFLKMASSAKLIQDRSNGSLKGERLSSNNLSYVLLTYILTPMDLFESLQLKRLS